MLNEMMANALAKICERTTEEEKLEMTPGQLTEEIVMGIFTSEEAHAASREAFPDDEEYLADLKYFLRTMIGVYVTALFELSEKYGFDKDSVFPQDE